MSAILEIGRTVKARLSLKLRELSERGYWRCLGCDAVDCREEGEQGQPAHCSRCGSPRLSYQPAVFKSSLP
jgi:hypothetical protein